MKLACSLTATAAFSLLSTGALAQSAKFAATYDTDVRMVEVMIDGTAVDGVDEVTCVEIDPDEEADSGDEYPFCSKSAGPIAEADIASLHVANWKELLLGQSAQVNLVTFTQAKGKNGGGIATAVAEGTVRGGVLVVPADEDAGVGRCSAAFAAYDSDPSDPAMNLFAAPGPVTFASRRQELSVTVDLDIIGSVSDLEGNELADTLGIDGSVTVALGLDTTAAHHFNFVEANLTSGWYDMLACYDVSALAGVGGNDIDVDTAAHSKVVLGPRIITVQEVRATKSGIIDETTPPS